MTRREKLPSGRAGALDGLPSNHRVAATWRDNDQACFYRNEFCRGNRVLIHQIDPLEQHWTTPTCLAHAISRHGVHPGGYPTAQYVRAVNRPIGERNR